MATNVTAGPTAHKARRPGPHVPAASGRKENTHTIEANQSGRIGSDA
jgi:hypothetical protein